MKRLFPLLSLLLMGSLYAQVIPLWPEGLPNCPVDSTYREELSEKIGRKTMAVQTPSIEVFLPEAFRATGQAVLICPGGGYYLQAYDWEGIQFAKWLNTKGIAAAVLKYRLPHWSGEGCREHVAIDDARRAMRLMRSHAQDWHIDLSQIGVMGFSAGGHLAATLATQPQDAAPLLKDAVAQQPARPDFAILIYPVITGDTAVSHAGSFRNLLGDNPSNELLARHSADLNVTANTPPTFLLHASDDKGVPPENSIRFYQALQKREIPAELHLTPTGGHGFAMAYGHPQLQYWPEWLAQWLKGFQQE